VSWTQWTNSLQIEIGGRDGYLVISGRDGHYGPPRLVHARRNANHSRPVETHFQWSPGDCWTAEWTDFLTAIVNGSEPSGNGRDGLQAQRIIDAAYRSSRSRQWLAVAPVGGQLVRTA
jgi:predicted dehydrogenase